MEDKHVILGQRIKMIRMRCGMSQTECAKGIDVAQSHLSNIENGRSHVTMENLFSLRDLFQVPFSEFFIDLDKEYIDEKNNKSVESLNSISFDYSSSDDLLTISDLLEAVLYIKDKKNNK